MLRFLLVAAVIAIGADAVLYNGAYTQAVWRELSERTLRIGETARDAGTEPRS